MEIGNKVKVVDKSSDLFMGEGTVISIDKDDFGPRYSVEFGCELSSHFFDPIAHGQNGKKLEYIDTFRDEQLETIEIISTKVIAKRMFGRMCHQVFDWDRYADDEPICMINGCNNHSTLLAYTNFYGTVYRFHACGGCYERYHGKSTEEIQFG